MSYKIIRTDGLADDITTQLFDNYDDAYDILDSIYSDLCCSDADYDDRPYYEIVEVKKWINKANLGLLKKLLGQWLQGFICNLILQH